MVSIYKKLVKAMVVLRQKLTKPYFYSVFILEGTHVAFNKLEIKELKDTYRYKALRKALNNII